MAVNELKLFITVCALFRAYGIYNVGVWKPIQTVMPEEHSDLVPWPP